MLRSKCVCVCVCVCGCLCVFVCVRLYVCLCLYAHAHTNAHRFIVESFVFVNLINGVKHDTKGLFVTGTALCTSCSMQFAVWSCTAFDSSMPTRSPAPQSTSAIMRCLTSQRICLEEVWSRHNLLGNVSICPEAPAVFLNFLPYYAMETLACPFVVCYRGSVRQQLVVLKPTHTLIREHRMLIPQWPILYYSESGVKRR